MEFKDQIIEASEAYVKSQRYVEDYIASEIMNAVKQGFLYCEVKIMTDEINKMLIKRGYKVLKMYWGDTWAISWRKNNDSDV